MKYLHVQKSEGLRGTIAMPRSKTHSFRALVLASLADGVSTIRNPKKSRDWEVGLRAMQMYGATITEIEPDIFEVHGVAGNLQTPQDIIDVNNSGTMLAFITGVAAACGGWTVLTGDESLRTLRKISAYVIPPLEQLGVTVISTKGDGMVPFVMKGPVKNSVAHMDGTGCQPVFSVLLAAALAKNPVEIFVENPGETAYIDLLLYWFTKAGLSYAHEHHAHYTLPGGQIPKPFDAGIPLEWSAPGYPLLAAVLTPNSEIRIEGMDVADPYGDKEVITILQTMGADIQWESGALVARSSELHGVTMDMNKLPDQLPTIAVAACFAKGDTIITNTKIARWKECDRIAAIVQELTKMGAKITEKEDGLTVHQDGSWALKSATLDGYYDHRLVMALSVAGLACEGETIISDAQMVEKSFASYIPQMTAAGAKLEVTEENL